MFLVLEIFNLYLFCNIVAAFSINENVDNFSDLVKYQVNVDEWLYKVNSDYLNFNRLSSNLSWQQTVNPDDTNIEMINKLGSLKVKWIKNVCNQVKHLEERVLLPEQQRQLYLLCRGPNYTLHEINELTKIQTLMYEIYTSTEVCTKDEQYCYKGEPDLERIMSNPNSTPETLLWAWTNWHNEVGTQIRQVYPEFVQLMNIGAQRQSYHDIGEVWREELEIDNLETFVLELYEDIAPLYNDLHALIRYKLLKKYGPDIIDPYGLIPAHLLGNMWAQDWSSLISLLIGEKFDLESKIQSKNWTANEMVRKAEDFYISMNLSRMTDKFWKYSRFEKQTDKNVSCHGTAADLFATNDYRIIMCVDATLNDFYVIHHELGHIEYYMAYRDQPPIFREGTNSAFQESIGDTIMLGVMSPFHLHRLGLINDHQLMDPEYNMILLLYQALSKIPQIPYALLLDQYRWKIFNGEIEYKDMNRIYWRLNNVLRGIQSPVPRDETQFDAGAKFHIADNTPYIRYFLSYVLQFQIFKGMCDMAIFGKPLDDEFDQRKITFPLNRCDIYGSKPAGKRLRKFMEKGAGKHWTKILPIITGTNKISTKPLLAYFNPLHKWLKKQIRTFQIPVGW